MSGAVLTRRGAGRSLPSCSCASPPLPQSHRAACSEVSAYSYSNYCRNCCLLDFGHLRRQVLKLTLTELLVDGVQQFVLLLVERVVLLSAHILALSHLFCVCIALVLLLSLAVKIQLAQYVSISIAALLSSLVPQIFIVGELGVAAVPPWTLLAVGLPDVELLRSCSCLWVV
jgi:hypothetical protein